MAFAPISKCSRLLATSAAVALCLSLAAVSAFGQKVEAGRIVGHIDGIAVDNSGAHIKGWACQHGRPESLTVHIYANEAASAAAKGIFALAGKADLDEEPAVDAACKDTIGRKHRFDIPIPGAILVKLQGMPLFVHGIRVVGNVENAAIAGSGTTKFPDAPPVRREPASYPHVTGRYSSLDEHPRVFDTREELQDIARRASKQGTYSSGRYAALADRVHRDLTAKVDWDATYSGCDLEIYLRGFAYEQKPAYGNDRSDDELRAAMHGKPGLAPPHGSAIVAARAALYAALIKEGAAQLPDAPSASDAAAFAKRILLVWADHGFRDGKGAFRRIDESYCDLRPDGKPVVTQFGTFYGALTHSRGVIYSVHAQDLLQGIGELSRDEQQRLDAFHRNVFETIRSIHNQEYEIDRKWKYSDEIYNNQFVGHLTDSESVYGYRLRLILCEDEPAILGFRQDAWVASLRHNEREPSELVEIFRMLRVLNLSVWRRMSPEDLQRSGQHNERGAESLAVMVRLLAGHDLSHLHQINRYIQALESRG